MTSDGHMFLPEKIDEKKKQTQIHSIVDAGKWCVRAPAKHQTSEWKRNACHRHTCGTNANREMYEQVVGATETNRRCVESRVLWLTIDVLMPSHSAYG